jgi:hypothetical protein
MAYAILRNSGDQSIANNTLTAVTWNTEDADFGDIHTGSDAIVTLGPGLWLMIAIISWAANGTGYREVRITENGTTDIVFMDETGLAATFAQRMALPILWVVPPGGATYQVRVQQTSGGALSVLGVRSSYFMVAQLA